MAPEHAEPATSSTSRDELLRLARSFLAFQGELRLEGFEALPPSLSGAQPAAGQSGRKQPAPAPAPAARPAGSADANVSSRDGLPPSTPAAATAARPEEGEATAKAQVRRPAAKAAAKPNTSLPPSARALPPELRAILDELGQCKRCGLAAGRTNIVFGTGNPKARVMFIGEAPGRDEDLQGEPFVGAAGQLLDRMIQAMGLSRSDVYTANVVKCRPPKNRDPEPSELAACESFIEQQVRAIGPEVIVTLGGVAANALLHGDAPISALRGAWREYRGIPVMPTYHPAYLLRNPNEKRPVWDDLREVMKRLGLPETKRG